MDTEIGRLLGEKTAPGDILSSLDYFIKSDFGKMGYYLSAFACLIDFSKNELTYSNYGHPPQILLRARSGEMVLMQSQTFPVGMNPESGSIHVASVPFEKGDRLVLFTDGILDARNSSGEFYGSEHVEMFARTNKGLDVALFNEKLLSDVRAFQPGEQNDDIFLMTIQTK
jgi:sigma-B regulation protein RsbU (phosphoserine phosphatase)